MGQVEQSPRDVYSLADAVYSFVCAFWHSVMLAQLQVAGDAEAMVLEA